VAARSRRGGKLTLCAQVKDIVDGVASFYKNAKDLIKTSEKRSTEGALFACACACAHKLMRLGRVYSDSEHHLAGFVFLPHCSSAFFFNNNNATGFLVAGFLGFVVKLSALPIKVV